MIQITLPEDYTLEQLGEMLNAAFEDHRAESSDLVRMRIDAFGEHLTEVSMVLTHDQLQIIANAVPVIAVLQNAIRVASIGAENAPLANSLMAARDLMLHMLHSRSVNHRDIMNNDLIDANTSHVARKKGPHHA